MSDRAAKVQYLTAWLDRYQTGLQRYNIWQLGWTDIGQGCKGTIFDSLVDRYQTGCKGKIFDSLAGQIAYQTGLQKYDI
jgi:hypothetical protein